MRSPALLIILVVLAAGCIGQSTPTTQIESADLVIAANQPTVPAAPTAGSDFTARFTVSNQHKDRVATGVGVWIFDTGKCKLVRIGDKPVTEFQSYYDQNRIWPGLAFAASPYRTDFAPGQTEVVRMTLTAPSTTEMANLPATCPIRYKVDYSFTARTEMGIEVISTNRLQEVEVQTGARPTAERTLFIGGGPIRVQLDPTSALPVETGRKISFTVTIKNDGEGEFSKVDEGKLKMKVPAGMTVPTDLNGKPCGDFFTLSGDSWVNARKIDVVQKVSNPVTCTFTAPGSDKVPIQQQLTFSAELPYDYNYFGQEIAVPITP